MKRNPFLLLAAGLAFLSACASSSDPVAYTVTYPAGDDLNNTMAYLYDWDTSTPVDSVLVSNGVAKFTGKADAPFIGRLMLGGARGPYFFVESGEITFDSVGTPSGTPLNDKLDEMMKRRNAITDEFRTLDQEDSLQYARAQQLEKEMMQIPVEGYKANKGSLLGTFWFLQMAYEMNLQELDSAIAADPQLKDSKRVESIRNGLLAKKETSEGCKYKDFTVTYDGKDQKLSDFVGDDHYTLVDFWASWCGPCIRQTRYIKELNNKYKDQGLQVVGVAVWDEPENTLKAIESHGLEWPCIINGQTGPTDLYGINGIPCIILIAPDGTIVLRDKQSEELVEGVDKFMADFAAQKAQAPQTAAE